jgi:5-methylcytosine-specific restriction endonuclease McrA
MKMPVLVLNADYLPHRVIDWKDAFVLIYSKDSEAAHIAATYSDVVKDSMGRTYNLPAVIVLNTFVQNNNKHATYSKSAIHLRDNYTCQYCLGRFPRGSLTIDHVIPKSKANKIQKGMKVNSFENCVSSCFNCNSKKADRTPKEAGMALSSIPRPITRGQKVLLDIKSKRIPVEWKPYVDSI